MPVVSSGSLRFAELPGRLSADPLPAGSADAGSVRVVRIAAGAVRTPHRHPRSAEVIYVVTGAGHAWEDGVYTPVAAGDLVLVATGVPHATLPGPSGLTLVCFFPDPDLPTNREELTEPILHPPP